MESRPLWSHQQQAIDFLAAHKGQGLLHIDMGGGKSRIVVEYVRAHPDIARTLIVCPKSVTPVWASEFARWWPEGQQVVTLNSHSTSKRAQTIEALPNNAVVVVNYEAFWRQPLRDAIVNAHFDLVVYDESHRIKMPGGKASLFAAYLRSRIPQRVLLTGTPLPHSPLDIYAQYRALDTSTFGTSFVAFRSRYAVMGGFENRQVVSFKRLDELHDRIASRSFRVSGDALDKPEFVDTSRYCLLEPHAQRTYRQLENALIAEVEAGTVTAANALVKLLRLQQLTSGVLRTDDGQEVEVSHVKRDLLKDTLLDLRDDEPVVVFCRFHKDLDAVHQVAAVLGRGSLELSGRRNELAQWQAGDAPLLATQTQTGSLGVSMVRACYAIFYDLSFSLGEYQQAKARLVRPGQQRPVTFVHLVATGTIDEHILTALRAKANVVEAVLRDIVRGSG